MAEGTDGTTLWLQTGVQKEVQSDELGITSINVKHCSYVGVGNLQLISVCWYNKESQKLSWNEVYSLKCKLNYEIIARMYILKISDFYKSDL